MALCPSECVRHRHAMSRKQCVMLHLTERDVVRPLRRFRVATGMGSNMLPQRDFGQIKAQERRTRHGLFLDVGRQLGPIQDAHSRTTG